MATTLKQPVILISGGDAGSASVQSAAAMISGTGAIPMIVTNHIVHTQSPSDLLAKADGVLFMGNNADIDPKEYGQTPHPQTENELLKKDGSVSPEGTARRDFEVSMLQQALFEKMPVLGICGGLQRINVLCGGTLHQHVPDVMPDGQKHDDHTQMGFGVAPFVAVQPVEILQSTNFGRIAEGISTVYTPTRNDGNIVLDTNSMHHQAIDKVGDDLRATALSEDRLINGQRLVEAVEADPKGKYGKQFLMGVQWHPEFSDNPLGPKLAAALASSAKQYAMIHNRAHTLEEVQEVTRTSTLAQLKQPEGRIPAPGGRIEELLSQRASAKRSL